MIKNDDSKKTDNMAVAPWPFFEQDEIDAVTNVLKSGKVNYWTGDLTKKFEQEFASYHGTKYGIALANGTLALELALIGLGVGPGDEVITSTRTFIASASCIVRVGAKPVLADIEPASQNVTVETLKQVVTPKTKALIVVHLAGWPCDMPAIMSFARDNNLYVIEDCAQAHGAKIGDRFVGSFGHMAAFSFCQDKIMTTGGEGGILLLNDEDLYKKMWAFKDHGKSYDAVYNKAHSPGFRWLHESFGTNWRLTEMQAVIGLLQLKKLETWVEKRRALASRIITKLSDENVLRFPVPSGDMCHSYYKLYGYLDLSRLKTGWNRDRFIAEVSAKGIPCYTGSCGEIYLEKAFTDSEFALPKPLPQAHEGWISSVMFLVHPTLNDEYVDDLVDVVRTTLKEATI